MAEDLWTIARQRLQHYEVAPPALAFLEKEMRAAQLRLDTEPARGSEAQANVRLLVDTMAEIGVEQYVPLTEEVYFAARSRLCPLFPIC